MSKDVVEKRFLNPWLEREELDRFRTEFVSENKSQFSDFYRSNEHFADIDPQMQDLLANLITHFMFGVVMTYRRFGFKYPIYELNYDTEPKGDDSGIGFLEDDNCYTMKLSVLKEMLAIVENTGSIEISGGGINVDMELEDFFEIAGIEEAAHLIFYNEKGHTGKPAIGSERNQYYTSEIESRALFWKLAYTKRYMPQYHASLVETYSNAKLQKST